MRDARPHGSLRARIALAFAAVAILAVAVLAAVVAVESRSETQRVSDAARRQAASEVAAALARAYREQGSWTAARVDAAAAIAARDGAVLVVRDANGSVVIGGNGGRGPGAGRHAGVVTVPIEVGEQRVGSAELRYPGGLARAEQQLRRNLLDAVVVGSAISVVLALLVAAAVSGRIVRPLRRLTAVARRLRAGDLGARAAQSDTPGELGELARALDEMAEAQERASRTRSQLVADLSHEVRTPLTILRGNLEELIDGIEEPTPARLASLHEEVLRLDGLVEQLDALGRAGTVVREPDREPVDLAQITAAALEALTPELTAKRLSVRRALAPVVVHGDRVKLGQVVANLLSNALKFTGEGGTIDVGVARDGSESATLVVADDGPGLAAEERERAFDRFWRGSAAAGVAGRGIGLALVQEIVSAHGGTVSVDESPMGGARFTVTLPRGPAVARTGSSA